MPPTRRIPLLSETVLEIPAVFGAAPKAPGAVRASDVAAEPRTWQRSLFGGSDSSSATTTPGWEMDPAINAFVALASRDVELRPCKPAGFGDLVRPVHQSGRVFGWEITPLAERHNG